MLVPVSVHNRFAERLQPHHVALILTDCQADLLERATDRSSALRNNILGLAHVACAYDLPVLASTFRSSRHGPLLPELAVLLSERQAIGRSSPGIWDNQPIQRRIHALGRRDLIIAGIARDGEFLNLALSAQYHGYRVHVVADASAGGDLISQRVAAAAMSAAGVKLTNWVAIMAELTATGGPGTTSAAARVAGALSAVTKYLTRYSTRAIQWGGDEVHLAASKGA